VEHSDWSGLLAFICQIFCGEIRNMALHGANAEKKGIDSIGFYNAYLKKYDNEGERILVDTPAVADSQSLLVIDMQDDFLLLPPGVGNPHGRFCVQDGLGMAGSLRDFILKHIKKGTFSKIVFSRDTHTFDHCSFGNHGGPFPNHCVANHVGAKFHDSMKHVNIESKNGTMVDVIFKGCSKMADSFGAVSYPDDDYSNERQLGNCSMGEGLTGGFYLKNKANNFVDYPFVGISKYELSDERSCPASTEANIYKELDTDNPFKISDLFGAAPGKTHNIYVVGVAGDYCVKDTVMNIRKQVAASGGMIDGVNVNVYVLQPFVRYGFLPLQFLGGKNVYKSRSVVSSANFTKLAAAVAMNQMAGEYKDLNKYVFRIGPIGQIFMLDEKEHEKAITAIEKIVPFNGLNMGEAIASNPGMYASFLSPVLDLIKDYKANNVTMLLDIPSVLSTSGLAVGGGRNKKRRNTKAKRNNRKNRKTNRRQ
jgi:nicotinamidase-related amidase